MRNLYDALKYLKDNIKDSPRIMIYLEGDRLAIRSSWYYKNEMYSFQGTFNEEAMNDLKLYYHVQEVNYWWEREKDF